MINGEVSHWWHQIGLPEPRERIAGPERAEVAIVGAGYTGLWTAYYLKKHAPEIDVLVLEQRHIGYGASGRNGGWLSNSITGGRDQHIAAHGREGVEAFQRAFNDAVDEVIRVTEAEGIDADIVKGGELTVALNAAQERRLLRLARAESEWESSNAELLNATQASERIAVDGIRAGLWHPHAARIHPAKLVRGLAEACEGLGVRIAEGVRVTDIRPHRLETDAGPVEADWIVRATEGFTARLPGQRRSWLPMNSSMIVTEPLPAWMWEQIGWAGREVLGDEAHIYMYAQRTADDRIAFGGRGVPYKYGSRTDLDGETPGVTVDQLGALMHRFFPVTSTARIAHTWSGVLGVPRDWTPSVGLDQQTRIGWAGGYVGTGVTATNLAGRTLADLILRRDTELTGLPWVDRRVRRWEPEPLRWLATRGLYGAYGYADAREQAGRTGTSKIARVADLITGKGR